MMTIKELWTERDGYGITTRAFVVRMGAAIVALFLVMIVLTVLGSHYSCSRLAVNTGHQTRWTWANGCLVHTHDGWVPSDRWRVIE